ncbi:MAG: lamin tail domain-containing protein, partial [Kiritimatiellae bacterium]|nr:lamin tail domain-containing protein [Kiritimatiellia bacterium]
PSYLSNAVKSVKTFIASRRNYLMNSSWSDKDTNIWAGLPAYDPGTVVINEIMPDPASGGEYLELYNRAPYAVDLSWWKLQIGDEEYRIPHGVTVGPTSYVVLADTQSWLTNAYQEISDPALMVLRHAGGKVWDWPIVWTSAVEHSTRIIEVPSITLPNAGADISLTDVCSNLIDSLTYTNAAPWPYTAGISMELLDAAADNSQATNWRTSFVVGTPGFQNSTSADADEDGMNDEFEELIIAASGGAFSNIFDVAGTDDFDNDGLPNFHEYVMGTDPLTDDSSDWLLEIAVTNSEVHVSMQTLAATGTAYYLYSRREYTFEQAAAATGTWSGIFGWQGLTGDGQRLVLTNSPPEDRGFYRGYIQLVPLRQP